ncbi:hypothetical protein D3C78_1833710 [compost metagenome]
MTAISREQAVPLHTILRQMEAYPPACPTCPAPLLEGAAKPDPNYAYNPVNGHPDDCEAGDRYVAVRP